MTRATHSCASGRAHPLATLQSLPAHDTVAIIINVDTRIVSTLALASALRYSEMPVVLIDCESSDGSHAFFETLNTSRDFYLHSRPLMSHGKALDEIIASLNCRRVLLIDSDIEIKHERLIPMMAEAMDARPAWGAGFLHEAGWLNSPAAVEGWFVERMWIPLVLLEVKTVQGALRAGVSFDHRKVANDVSTKWLAYLLSLRFVLPYFRARRLDWMNRFRPTVPNVGVPVDRKPSFVYYDTGADMYQYLQAKSDSAGSYAPIPLTYSGSWLTHQHGVTRKKLRWWDANSTNQSSVVDEISDKLRNEYGIEV